MLLLLFLASSIYQLDHGPLCIFNQTTRTPAFHTAPHSGTSKSPPSNNLGGRRGTFSDTLGATTGLGNYRDGLFRHQALFTRLARLLGEFDKEASTTAILQLAAAGAWRGTVPITAATLVQEEREWRWHRSTTIRSLP